MNDTHASSLSKSWNLSSNSCRTLNMSWEHFSEAFSKAIDAGAGSFSIHLQSESEGIFWPCKCTEKWFILALNVFAALIISEVFLSLACSSQQWFSYFDDAVWWFSFPLTSVRKPRSSTDSVSCGEIVSSLWTPITFLLHQEVTKKCWNTLPLLRQWTSVCSNRSP